MNQKADKHPPAALSSAGVTSEQRTAFVPQAAPDVKGTRGTPPLAGTAKPSHSFSFRENSRFPRLGWIARLPLAPGTINVVHGSQVETTEDWFVEGAWDGSLEHGDFDRSYCFFGSGIRLRGDAVQIVASRATVDSLFYWQSGSEVVVSNSLLLLLASTGARLDARHSYEREFSGAVKGIRKYKQEIPVIHDTIREIRQLYFGNLTIADGRTRIELPDCPETFSTYAQYRAFLVDKLQAICANATSAARRHPMACYATLSTGYDSPAIATLAKKHCGIDVCITTNPEARGATPVEDARSLAETLGMKTVLIDVADGSLGKRELFYYAANYQHFEMAFDKAARIFEAKDSPVLLLTGYHGDKVWDRNLKQVFQSDELRRGDMSGKGLGEIRLKSGFVNAAIPFLGAREVSQIVAISRSPEMAAWSVGGDYDRPIPRRICEEAGLERESFGQRKHKITSHKARPPDPDLRAAFERDLKSKFAIGPARLLLFELLDRMAYRLNRYKAFNFLAAWKRSLLFGKPHLRMVLFIWAVNRAADMLQRETRS